MASGSLSSISAAVGHGRARGGMEELRGEVAQLGGQWIEVGRRGLAGATSDGDFARFCSLELDLAQRKENGERNGSFKASTRIRAPTLTSTGAGMAGEHHSDEHSGDTVHSFK